MSEKVPEGWKRVKLGDVAIDELRIAIFDFL